MEIGRKLRLNLAFDLPVRHRAQRAVERAGDAPQPVPAPVRLAERAFVDAAALRDPFGPVGGTRGPVPSAGPEPRVERPRFHPQLARALPQPPQAPRPQQFVPAGGAADHAEGLFARHGFERELAQQLGEGPPVVPRGPAVSVRCGLHIIAPSPYPQTGAKMNLRRLIFRKFYEKSPGFSSPGPSAGTYVFTGYVLYAIIRMSGGIGHDFQGD